MSEPVSRQGIKDALDVLGPFHSPLVGAAQAILDAPPLEWCDTHDDPRIVCDDVPAWKAKGETPCRFQSGVWVKVSP